MNASSINEQFRHWCVALVAKSGQLADGSREALSDEVYAIILGHKAESSPTLASSGTNHEAIETEPERAERKAPLDLQRNERDRQTWVGYDYARLQAPGYVVHFSPYVDVVIEADCRFGLCAVCAEPTGKIMLSNQVANGKRHFCGVKCVAQAHANVSIPTD
jgi:hypothetical protein